jgi:hypothetical protein
MKDLIVLVADANMKATFIELLKRDRSLGIRKVSVDVFAHSRRDPGVYREACHFLQPLRSQYQRALAVLDCAWAGAPEGGDPQLLETEIRSSYSRIGIGGWAEVVAIDPELEAWVWSISPHVESALGWYGRNPDLRTWLSMQSYLSPGHLKPNDPKLALEKALKEVKRPRTSSIFSQLARTVGFDHCQDSSFLRLKRILQNWFLSGDLVSEN